MKQKDPNPTEKQKWATFTFTGRETTFITNIFRRINIKIAFRTNNNIVNRLIHKQQKPTNAHYQEYTDLYAPYVTKLMWAKPVETSE